MNEEMMTVTLEDVPPPGQLQHYQALIEEAEGAERAALLASLDLRDTPRRPLSAPRVGHGQASQREVTLAGRWLLVTTTRWTAATRDGVEASVHGRQERVRFALSQLVAVEDEPLDRVKLGFADGTSLLLEPTELPDGFWEACGLPEGG